MNKIVDIVVRGLRKAYPIKYQLGGQVSEEYFKTIDPAASTLISNAILGSEPLMISRFGSTELNCLSNYLGQIDRPGRYLDFIRNKTRFYKWNQHSVESMCLYSGFFPQKIQLLDRFAKEMIEDIKQIDILASWLNEEVLFNKELADVKRIGFLNLEPYNHQNPWSKALEGLTVLVVHPFDFSIREQYKRRELIFENPDVLPPFELKTLKAVQSIANNPTQYNTWFDALESMKEKISAISFDIAIIGCGAYGMPLAAHVKRLGKKAVHLGGATQVLFGIKGKRWEAEDYGDGYKQRLINEYWVRPADNEIPQNFTSVEEGCYW